MSQAQALFDKRFVKPALYSKAFLDGYIACIYRELGELPPLVPFYTPGTADYDAACYGRNEARNDARIAKTLARVAADIRAFSEPTSFNEGEMPCC